MAVSVEKSNRVILQAFEWHTTSTPSSSHWAYLTRSLPKCAKLGVTDIWLPPGCKAGGPQSNGYDIYDLWDLGEFEQKGARHTKWGSREELDQLLKSANELDINIIWDAVLNHKQGGDRVQGGVWAVEVDEEDRRYEMCPPKQIEAWLQYDFPGREKEGMKYSSMRWRGEHFNGTDWDQSMERNAIYKLIDDPSTHPTFKQPKILTAKSLQPPRSRFSMLRRRWSGQKSNEQQSAAAPARRPGKGWAEDVDKDRGNNDYLLFTNVDYTNPEVRKDVRDWGRWMVQDVGIYGFRLDAARHFSWNFTRDWIQEVSCTSKQKIGRDAFVVGEVWDGRVNKIVEWLDAVQQSDGRQVHAYDSPLLYNFSRISEDFRKGSKNLDLRTILRGSLVHCRPEAAVTLVTNHDTQVGQRCYTPMDRRLKALFYAFILLRKEGVPCIFWGDLFGTNGPETEGPGCLAPDERLRDRKRNLLLDLMTCRRLFAFGEQKDYWDSQTCIGWTRAGLEESGACAIVLNISSVDSVRKMQVGEDGITFIDILGQVKEEVKVDKRGYASFPCKRLSVSVFAEKDSPHVSTFPVDLELDAAKAKA